MARKPTQAQIEAARSLSVVRAEMAQEVYDAQDIPTRVAIDLIVIKLKKNTPVEIHQDVRNNNVFWLAMEIVKDLSFCGIRVANFEMPDGICVRCGSEAA